MAIAFLNGDWMQPEEAKVSVFDRGFMFGDGVYEVMPVYGGRVFTLPEHVERLLRSLKEIRLETPYNEETWSALIQEAVARSEEVESLVYLQVTRGVA
ncbi:MAG: aminotransferase class IV, partial [Gammaproteobacteria bacterium]